MYIATIGLNLRNCYAFEWFINLIFITKSNLLYLRGENYNFLK